MLNETLRIDPCQVRLKQTLTCVAINVNCNSTEDARRLLGAGLLQIAACKLIFELILFGIHVTSLNIKDTFPMVLTLNKVLRNYLKQIRVKQTPEPQNLQTRQSPGQEGMNFVNRFFFKFEKY